MSVEGGGLYCVVRVPDNTTTLGRASAWSRVGNPAGGGAVVVEDVGTVVVTGGTVWVTVWVIVTVWVTVTGGSAIAAWSSASAWANRLRAFWTCPPGSAARATPAIVATVSTARR